MKLYKLKIFGFAIVAALFSVQCNNDDNGGNPDPDPDFSGTYVQEDQMGRPAVNTVLVSAGSKDAFNITIPSEQNADFQGMFETNLVALSPAYANPGDQNLLGLDAATFTGLLATDVLTVSTTDVTSFFDGVNVLTGRALDDDVITVELVLICVKSKFIFCNDKLQSYKVAKSQSKKYSNTEGLKSFKL